MRVRVFLNDGNSFPVERVDVVKLLWPTEDRTSLPDMRMAVTERSFEINMGEAVAFSVEARRAMGGNRTPRRKAKGPGHHRLRDRARRDLRGRGGPLRGVHARPRWALRGLPRRRPQLAPEVGDVPGLQGSAFVTADSRPGHETDALVAERVMGWTRSEADSWWHDGKGETMDRVIEPGRNTHMPGFQPSTMIESAWRVVEHLLGKPRWLSPTVHWIDGVRIWQAGFYGWDPALKNSRGWYADARTAPLAISLAALKVAGVDP